MDHPNDRSSHVVPTPRGGGVGLLTAAMIGIVVGWALRVVRGSDAALFIAGLAILGVLGWLDDRRGLAARYRLAVHFAVAAATAAALGGFPIIHFGTASVHLGLLGYAIAVLGLVWSINLFNFMDGIDGLAGSQAVLILGFSAAWLLARGEASVGFIAAVLAASSAGFLILNWPPAKIFLGDAGSGALGFAIGTIALISERRGSVPLVAFAILAGAFIGDATVTLLRRLARGRSPAEAHRDHAYQRMTRACQAHLPVTLGAACLTLALAALGFAATTPAWTFAAFAGACAVIGATLFFAERRSPMR